MYSTLITLACLTLGSLASPLKTRDVYTDPELQPTREAFRGIYWDDANKECQPGELAILIEGTRVAMQMTNNAMGVGDSVDTSAAWNRYFVSDSTIKNPGVKGKWTENQGFMAQKENMLSIMRNLQDFAVKGKKNQNGEYVRAKQISYHCKDQSGRTNCQKPGVRAYTLSPKQMGGEGWGVVYCPSFFDGGNSHLKPRYSNDIIRGPKLGPSSMPTLYTYEGIIIHEWLHNNIATGRKSDTQITDIHDILPDDPIDLPENQSGIYGDTRTHKFGWKFIGQHGQDDGVNYMTGENADSYAWFYAYKWFAKAWGWKDDGSGFYKRDLERRDDPSLEDVEIDPDLDNWKSPSDYDINKIQAPQNCANVGTKDAPEWNCAYMGEDGDSYSDDIGQSFQSDGGCELSAKCHVADGFAVDPSCTCTCGGTQTGLSDDRCKGFAGSLPDPPKGGPGNGP